MTVCLLDLREESGIMQSHGGVPSHGFEEDAILVTQGSGTPGETEDANHMAIGTGEAHTVREFVELAFAHAGLDWKEHVEVDARYFRPAEVDYLCADASKARRVLGWEPAVTFGELVRIMVEADMQAVEARLKGGAEALQFAVVAEGRHS